MGNRILTVLACLLLAISIGCNPANVKAPPPPPQSDTINLRCQLGYRDKESGSFINLYDCMQFVHSTATDSSYALFHFDSVLAATNYHLDMYLDGIKHNHGKFDLTINCMMNLLPRSDSSADSSCMFIAQCNTGAVIKFDTIRVQKQDKSFTIHINNATAAYYYIALWAIYPVHGSTIAFRDAMITVPK